MKHRTTSDKNRKGARSGKGFTLISIMAVGFFAIAMMMSLFPLILQSSNSETSIRNSTELRNAAEVAIDYGIVLLNQGIANKQATPLDLALNEYVKDYKPLDPLFADYPGISVTLRIKKLQTAEWVDVKNFSSIYSPLLNKDEPYTLVSKDNWRVLEATATKGTLTRSIRVILEPRYDLSPSNTSDITNPTSYFSNSFIASSRLTTATSFDDGLLTIQPVNSLDTAEMKTSATNPDPSNTLLDHTTLKSNLTPSDLKIAPVPVDLTATSLSLSDFASNGQPLTSGSYKTANLDTSTLVQPVTLDTSSGKPVKIFIQDGNLPGTEIKISTSRLQQDPGANSSRSGDLQLFYEGTRNINIELSSAQFYAVIYAPNAQINVSGTGAMETAMVGSKINLTNSGTLKIDTELGDTGAGNAPKYDLVYDTTGATEPTLQGYRTVSWKETTKRLAPLIN